MPTPKRYVGRGGTVTYRVRFRHNGKETSETFDELRDAQVFCDDVENHGADYAVRLLDEDEEVVTSPTLDVVAEAFFEWKAHRVRSDRTIHDYRRDYRLAIAPTLGGMRVAAITDREVQRWVDDMTAGTVAPRVLPDGGRAPLNPKSIGDRHALLHAIVKWAAGPSGGRIITGDPCATTDLPRRRKQQPRGLRPAEWHALHAALTAIDPAAADLAAFLLASGWRWSEATALDAWAVDDDGTTITVTMGRVFRRDASGAMVLVEGQGKRDASLRRVRLDPATSAMVRRRVVENRDAGLVFRTPISPQNGLGGNAWNYQNFLRRAWNPAVELANLARRPTPHWLRHTHVAWMVAAGGKLPEIQARIGHASITTTINVYGSMVTDVAPVTLDVFGSVMGGTDGQRIAAIRPAADGPD